MRLSVQDAAGIAATVGPDLSVGTEGEFKGWLTSTHEGFFSHIGPFWQQRESDGSARCAFRVQKKHLNGFSNVHGGCLLAFADYCIFAIASPIMQGPGVTVNFASSFIDTAREGDLILGRGEITRAGGALVFVRGQLTVEDRTLFTFSGTIKRVKQKAQSSA